MYQSGRLALLFSVLLSACASTQQSSDTTRITIFSINDFHGNLQAAQPVPYMAPVSDASGQATTVPAGGYAYLTTMLKQRRQAVSASILVGAGDLIGASPLGSALLKDEPVIEALNQLDLSVTAVGNHEFDSGTADLMRKMKGECPASGCVYAGFRGARFDYLGANVIDIASNTPWLRPYVIRQVGDVKVGFIGAVTADVPNLVAGDAVRRLRFEDEATAINRYVPELQQQGVATIVALIHEGAMYKGPENDATYRCEGLDGPVIDIARRLDKAIGLVVSGHSHQGYTCKIDGRLVVQGRSYGAFLTESTLTLDKKTGRVIDAVAHNHLISQQQLQADPTAQVLVDQVARQTTDMRLRPVVTIPQQLHRFSDDEHFDSRLGNVIADAQLHFAHHAGVAAELSVMNEGGIRSDLPSGKPALPVAISYGDLYAVQPFGNTLMRLTLSGAQIMTLLQQQWQGRDTAHPKKLFVSHGMTYRWNPALPVAERIQDVRIKGQPLEMAREYGVIVNHFLADGGDGFSVLKQARERQMIGRDLDAFESYVREKGSNIGDVRTDRVQQIKP